MTKLNLINKHWLNIQCSSCRHDVSVPVQKFIDLGINDIFEVKAKSKCKQCGRKGDRLYVDTNANPYYGDDVIVTLLEKGKLYVCATRIVKMKTHTDGNGNEWQGYGCIATSDEQYLYELALKERWGQDTFNEERNKNIDWFFVLTRTPEVADKKRDMREYPDGMGDVNHLLARSVHVVIGCERKRISDNFTRPNPRQKRQMEAAQDAEWQLTPFIGYTQDEQDWLHAELDKDFEE